MISSLPDPEMLLVLSTSTTQKDGTPFASLPRLGVCSVLLSSTWPKPQSQQHRCGANSCPCFQRNWMLFGYPRRGGRITYICRQAIDDGPPRLRAGMCTSGRSHILPTLAVSIIVRRTRFAVDSLCIIQDSKDDRMSESSRMGEIYSNGGDS